MKATTTRYGWVRCDVAHATSYTSSPLATVDLGRHMRSVGGPGLNRYLCDDHARGLRGWRDSLRMVGAPAIETAVVR